MDGAQGAINTGRVPLGHDAGGMDDVIGSLNNSTSKSPTVQKVEHSPL